ncbi:MAG: hypothetical protein ACRCS8_01450 [Brevinema sp.]
MSIIDDIYQIESAISEIKNKAVSDITKLQEQEKVKERMLKEEFEQKYFDLKAEQDSYLQEKIEAYKVELFKDLDTYEADLRQQFEQHKDAILKTVTQEFWQE